MWPPPLYRPGPLVNVFLVRIQSADIWCCSRFVYGGSTISTHGAIDAAFTIFQSTILTPMSALISPTASIAEVYYYCATNSVQYAGHLFNPGTAGTASGDCLPAAFGACISRFNSFLRERPYPRFICPFITTDQVADVSRLTATARTAYESLGAALCTTLHTGFGGDFLTPCYFEHGHTVPLLRLFNAYKVAEHLSYLHRRRIRRDQKRVPVYPEIGW